MRHNNDNQGSVAMANKEHFEFTHIASLGVNYGVCVVNILEKNLAVI